MLNIIVGDELDDVVALRCVGSLVLGEETALLCPAIARYGHTILLDLSLIDRIDAAGIGALIALQAAGVYVTIVNPSKAVSEVLRITHVDSLFEIVVAETAQRAGSSPSVPASPEPVPSATAS